MILTSDEVRKLIDSDIPLIENADPEQIEGTIEGGAYDLRVGKVYEDSKANVFYSRIGRRQRLTPKILDYKHRRDNIWTLFPFGYYLLETIEKVNVPPNLRGMIAARSTWLRCGAKLITTDVAPGYKGTLTFGVKVFVETPIELEKGARIAAITFHQFTNDEPACYRGVWQGGKVSTNGKKERGF